MNDIRVIALDLDGTLLDSDKNLSAANRAALVAAAARGVEIVPTTGRFFGGMPKEMIFDQDSIVCVSENAGDIIYT